MINNVNRAEWAKLALDPFADEVMGGNVDEETVQDLITDLGHYARHGLGMSREEVISLFQIAVGAWSAEDRAPLEEPMANDLVRVEIHKMGMRPSS